MVKKTEYAAVELFNNKKCVPKKILLKTFKINNNAFFFVKYDNANKIPETTTKI